MRSRNIKPGVFENEILGTADPFLTLTFQGLWLLADKEGRLEDRSLRIKAKLFPYRPSLDVNGYLTELSRLGFIQRYRVAGQFLIQVVNFPKHQSPHHTEKASVLAGLDTEGAEIIGHAGPPLTNGEVTPSAPSSNGGNRPDSLIHRFTDSLIPEINHSTTAPPAVSPTKASKRGTRIPEDFTVTEEHRAFARKHGFPSPDDEIDEFRDYWRAVPGQKGCKLDWDATFRNRLRQKKTKVNGNANGNCKRNDETIDRAAARMAL
jgi:hypothetical protein